MKEMLVKKGFVLLAMVCMALCAQAQGTGGISGKVSDEKGNPVGDVSVHVFNTNLVNFTNAAGEFLIADLAAGHYVISFSAAGFATRHLDVDIQATGNRPLQVQLTDNSRQLDEVVVTAQKREESVQDVPAAVTVLNARQVNEYQLWDTKQLTALVPGLYANNSGDMRNVTSIRGITTTSYDPAVATYIDGVNQFSLDTYIASLSDIERIEVLRGPQGTLYGRNAMGGVINIITKQPTNQTTGFAEATIGNHGQQRYTAGIRFPIIKNKLFFGASGLYSRRNGFYTNTYNNTSFDKQHSFGGNYYLKYLPDAKWALTLNVKHQDNRNNGAFPMSGSVDDGFQHPFQLAQNAVGVMHDNTLNASLAVNHAGALANFTSLTAWQTNYRYYDAPIDGDFSPADAVSIINNYGNKWNNVKVFTQEFRLFSSANNQSKLKYTSGVYFFHQYNPVKQATHFGADAALVGAPDVNFATLNTTKGNNTGAAVYGQLNYALTRKLEIIGGLRYDYEHKKLEVAGDYMKDGGPSFTTQADTAASAHFNALSPKLGLSYQAAVNTHLFANYSRGYRTGGLTQLSSDPSQQPPLYPYKPEYSNNIEIGLKNSFWNNRLNLFLTAFYTHVADAQVPTLILPDAITVTKNTGKLNSKGVEAELSAAPFKGLSLNYNFGYTHARYESLKVPSNGSVVNLDGKKQIFTPDVTSMLALQYRLSLCAKHHLGIYARGEWSYLGTTYYDLANTIRQAPYRVLNARAGLSGRNFDLYAWGRNLGDTKYIAYAYDFGPVHLADPKTYGMTLSIAF